MTALPERILCLVTDIERAGSEAALVRVVREAVRGGVNMVQVRGHELDKESLEHLATAIVSEVGTDAVVMVNGDAEVAAKSGAAGVHVREGHRIGPPEIGPGTLVGQSAHSLEAASVSQQAGVDYIVLGTIFPSASHPGGITGGAELITSVTRRVNVPVIGIGGITAENAGQVIAAGASGIAVIGAIIGSRDPFESARALASAIELPEQ